MVTAKNTFKHLEIGNILISNPYYKDGFYIEKITPENRIGTAWENTKLNYLALGRVIEIQGGSITGATRVTVTFGNDEKTVYRLDELQNNFLLLS